MHDYSQVLVIWAAYYNDGVFIAEQAQRPRPTPGIQPLSSCYCTTRRVFTWDSAWMKSAILTQRSSRSARKDNLGKFRGNKLCDSPCSLNVTPAREATWVLLFLRRAAESRNIKAEPKRFIQALLIESFFYGTALFHKTEARTATSRIHIPFLQLSLLRFYRIQRIALF